MSNCSEHKKDLFGESDMKVVAEAIGDLHYETLTDLLHELSDKLKEDSDKDLMSGRKKLSVFLLLAGLSIEKAWIYISQSYVISKPFMTLAALLLWAVIELTID